MDKISPQSLHKTAVTLFKKSHSWYFFVNHDKNCWSGMVNFRLPMDRVFLFSLTMFSCCQRRAQGRDVPQWRLADSTLPLEVRELGHHYERNPISASWDLWSTQSKKLSLISFRRTKQQFHNFCYEWLHSFWLLSGGNTFNLCLYAEKI